MCDPQAKETSYREVEKIRNAKDAELEDIHHRVQKTVAKKDETIVLLRASTVIFFLPCRLSASCASNATPKSFWSCIGYVLKH